MLPVVCCGKTCRPKNVRLDRNREIHRYVLENFKNRIEFRKPNPRRKNSCQSATVFASDSVGALGPPSGLVRVIYRWPNSQINYSEPTAADLFDFHWSICRKFIGNSLCVCLPEINSFWTNGWRSQNETRQCSVWEFGTGMGWKQRKSVETPLLAKFLVTRPVPSRCRFVSLTICTHKDDRGFEEAE